MSGTPPTLLVVNGHPLMHLAFEQLLGEEGELHFEDRAAAVRSEIDGLHPHVVVVDLCIGCSDRLVLVERLRATYPDQALIILYPGSDQHLEERLSKLDVDACLTHEETADRLRPVVRRLLADVRPEAAR